MMTINLERSVSGYFNTQYPISGTRYIDLHAATEGELAKVPQRNKKVAVEWWPNSNIKVRAIYKRTNRTHWQTVSLEEID